MVFHGSLTLFCLIAVVAGARKPRSLVDNVVKLGIQLSAPKLAAISVQDVDTYLNYTGRVRANFQAKDAILHGLDTINVKKIRIRKIRPAIEKVSISCNALVLIGNYSIKGTSYGAFKGPLDASGAFTILFHMVTLDFGASLDFQDFPKVKIKDILSLDVFVIDSKVQVSNFFEDEEKQKALNQYLSGLLPQFVNENVHLYREPIKNVINKKLL